VISKRKSIDVGALPIVNTARVRKSSELLGRRETVRQFLTEDNEPTGKKMGMDSAKRKQFLKTYRLNEKVD
jgi:hypothetical protein